MIKAKKKSTSSAAISGGMWSLISAGGHNLIRLAVVIVLARLLTPEEFGIAAAAIIIVSFSEVLMHMGIGSALVQSERDAKGIQGIALSLSIVSTALVILVVLLSSPALASFLNVPQLVEILPAMCIVFLVRGLTHPNFMLLNREMRFKQLAFLELFTYGFGYGAVAVTLAYMGYSYWSLVVATIVQAVLFSGAVFLLKPIKPRLFWKWSEGSELLRFGSGMLISQLLNNVARKGDNIIVSATMGPAALGLYSRAYALMDLANNVVGTAFYRVLFPAFSELRRSKDKEKLIRAFCVSQGLAAIIIMPVAVLMWLLAEDLILILLGQQWMEVVPVFQVLGIGMVLRLGYKVSGSMVAAAGAVYRGALRQAIYALLVLIGALAGSRYGLTGVAYAILIALVWQYISLTYLGLSFFEGKISRVFSAVAPAMCSSMISAVGLIIVMAGYDWSVPHVLIKVIALSSIYFFFYIAGVAFFKKNETVQFIRSVLAMKKGEAGWR